MWRAALALALVWGAHAPRAQASTYPERTVRIIVPSPAGGATDVVARTVVEGITRQLGRSWAIIENVGNSGGALGIERVTRAEPDGYTILVGGAGNLTVAPFLQVVSYDVQRDLAPVALINRTSVVVIAHGGSGLRSMGDVVARAKASPGKLDWATGGRGILPYLVGLAAMRQAGIDTVNVPYRGEAQAVTDILGGHMAMGFVGLPSASSLIRSGTVTALGVSSAAPDEDYPDIPPIAATLPGFDISGWYAVFATARTPEPVVAWLNERINAALREPEVRSRLRELGARPAGGPPKVLADEVAKDLAVYGDVARAFGIKPQ